MNSRYSMMFFNITIFFFIFAFSILCGKLSVDYVLKSFHHFGLFRIGKWSAYPQMGTANMDPYTRARTAKQGIVSLGRTEGIQFQIWQDNQGRPLHPHCHYLLKGTIPETRLLPFIQLTNPYNPILHPKKYLLNSTQTLLLMSMMAHCASRFHLHHKPAIGLQPLVKRIRAYSYLIRYLNHLCNGITKAYNAINRTNPIRTNKL